MKIAICAVGLSFYGGASRIVILIANRLNSINLGVTIISPYVCNEVREKLNKNIEIISGGRQFSSGFINYFWSAVFFLKKGLFSKHYDLVNIHNYPASFFMLGKSKKKCIWICNEPVNVELRQHSRVGFKKVIVDFLVKLDKSIVKRYVNKVVVADNYNKGIVKNVYGIDALTIPYGVDTDSFRYKPRKFINPVAKIIQIGVITKEKNQEYSIDLIHKLLNNGFKVELEIVGRVLDFNYFSMLKNKIINLNLERCVIFTKELSSAKIYNKLNNADLLIHPVVGQGGFLTVFESISSGCPVFLLNHLPSSSLIRDNNLGVVDDDVYYHIQKYLKDNYINTTLLKDRSDWVNNHLSEISYATKIIKVFSTQC